MKEIPRKIGENDMEQKNWLPEKLISKLDIRDEQLKLEAEAKKESEDQGKSSMAKSLLKAGDFIGVRDMVLQSLGSGNYESAVELLKLTRAQAEEDGLPKELLDEIDNLANEIEKEEVRGKKQMEGPVWKTKEGKILKVSEMETKHIVNCLKMIEAGVEKTGKETKEQTYAIDSFLSELEKRKEI